MHIVLPGGYPSPPYAAELAKHLFERAPSLLQLLEQSRARIETFDPATSLCTPFEAWQLARAGYTATPTGPGLGPLLAQPSANEQDPVWIADFVHLALGTDYASLVTADELAPSLKESRTLLDAIEPVLADHGFSATLIDAHRIRLTLPSNLAPETASPDTVAGQPLRAWWQTDPASRPWRRVLNEVQMVWHTHPVNEKRDGCGQLPINALWLYGGARPWTQTPTRSGSDEPMVRTELLAPARSGDWNAWLDACAALDASTLQPLISQRGSTLPRLTMTLMGETRIAHLTIASRPALLRWIPLPKSNWMQWWSRPV